MVRVCLVLQLGFNIRGGKASQLGIFISKVCPMGAAGTATGPVCVPWPLPLMNVLHGHGEGSCGQAACPVWEGSCGVELLPLPCPSQVIPDSDAHRAGLQEGDQVLSVNDVDFQDIEHSKVSTPAPQRALVVVPAGRGEAVRTPTSLCLSANSTT